ncbi:COX15/CtaA family protein [Beijerinckia sp. L45]|uniref:COX15/CtaA family protein n=1 Tax=Beijerinckia sp. L45 TaxID=1641855 RepID=UPI001FEE9060|nr:COX15/CtaA family protein [Beijerinckia sp. L45]
MTDLSLSRATVRDIAAAHVRGRTDAVSIWLWCVAALVMLMVVVGGATRLTESGLSITEWKPITGVIPPLTHEGWQQAFDKYKQIPQYQTLFPTMDLGGFQTIFLWEWTHRLIGRLLGFALLVPLIVFWARGMLSRLLKWQMLGIFALGGLQGFVGWWMVSSGLSGRVEVAQERLATHLLLASITLTALVWLASGQRRTFIAERLPAALRHLASLMIILVLVQIAMGGLVAGLRAGQSYNTWPLMNGHFIPPAADLGMLTPLWRNLVDNITAVQFQHRMTAYVLFGLAILQLVWTRRVAPGTAAARRSVAILGLVTLQAALGIITLVLVVPIWAGLLHQAFAMLVLIMTVVHRQCLGAKALACPEPASGTL